MRPVAPLENDDNPCRPRHYKPTLAAPSDGDTRVNRSLELSRNRLMVTAGAFLLAFGVISLRLADVTLLKKIDPEVATLGQPAVAKPAHFSRGDIVDRNGVVLATTLESSSLFANPRTITEPAKLAKQLAKILPGSKESDLYAKLASDKSFVWVQRRLTPTQEFQVNSLGVPGLDFQREERRIYPQGSLAAHVVGYTDLDGKGLAGIERSFDAALGQSTEPLKLSIDIRLQAILKEEIQKQIDAFTAVGGTGIIMDIKTGEVLSLISLPDFDPNDLNTVVPETIFNRATLGVYEMGSVFKIFNTALALENKTATLAKMYDISKPIQIGRFTIHDDEPIHHAIPVAQIFAVSSNIGSVHMVQELTPEIQKNFLGSLGLLRPAQIEIPEIGSPQVPNPWREINSWTIAFGHGLSVSPVQLAVAASAVADGGVLRPATLVKRPAGFIPPGQRILSPRTADLMRQLLRYDVTDGTGKKADVPGYLVGAKTGTAEKIGAHGGYMHHGNLSSLISFFPMSDPQYMVYVIIDEPHGDRNNKAQASYGFVTGAWTAGPAVQRTIARMAPLLGLKPIEETPDIHRGLTADIPGMGQKVAAN